MHRAEVDARVNHRKHTRAGGHIHTTGGHRGHTRRATCPRSHHAAGPADLREAECERADGVERAACVAANGGGGYALHPVHHE